jgi:hypothetical protein
MIIYPPYIADTIPAFTTEKVKIPFVMNPALDIDQVNYFQIKITNYNDSSLIGGIIADKQALNYNKETKSGIITFEFDKIENKESNTMIREGQYYKFHLSFSDGDSLSTVKFNSFSTASLGRCIGEPDKAP